MLECLESLCKVIQVHPYTVLTFSCKMLAKKSWEKNIVTFKKTSPLGKLPTGIFVAQASNLWGILKNEGRSSSVSRKAWWLHGMC